MSEHSELQRRLGSIDELLRKVETTADPSLRTAVQELIELVMNLNGAAIERMLELIRTNAAPELMDKLGADELTGSLLILYGLHPLRFETRVAQALDKTRARLRLHSGEVELLSVEDGAVRLRLHSSAQGCGSTARSLKDSVEEALYQAAPDLTALIIEGAEEKQSFVPLEMLRDSGLRAVGKGGL